MLQDLFHLHSAGNYNLQSVAMPCKSLSNLDARIGVGCCCMTHNEQGLASGRLVKCCYKL